MLSVSDILKLLDQIPIWKDLRALPRRVADLETRLAALEKPGAKTTQPCAECGAPAQIVAVTDHPVFGIMGKKQRTYECTGGHRHIFDWDPSKTD